jgi:hypothetical protein
LQSLFIIGFLNFKKLNNYPEAFEYFEKFIDESKNTPKYNYLLKIAYSYMDTIKSRMKLT